MVSCDRLEEWWVEKMSRGSAGPSTGRVNSPLNTYLCTLNLSFMNTRSFKYHYGFYKDLLDLIRDIDTHVNQGILTCCPLKRQYLLPISYLDTAHALHKV